MASTTRPEPSPGAPGPGLSLPARSASPRRQVTAAATARSGEAGQRLGDGVEIPDAAEIRQRYQKRDLGPGFAQRRHRAAR